MKTIEKMWNKILGQCILCKGLAMVTIQGEFKFKSFRVTVKRPHTYARDAMRLLRI